MKNPDLYPIQLHYFYLNKTALLLHLTDIKKMSNSKSILLLTP